MFKAYMHIICCFLHVGLFEILCAFMSALEQELGVNSQPSEARKSRKEKKKKKARQSRRGPPPVGTVLVSAALKQSCSRSLSRAPGPDGVVIGSFPHSSSCSGRGTGASLCLCSNYFLFVCHLCMAMCSHPRGENLFRMMKPARLLL